MEIGNRKIAAGLPPYVVADLSCSHCGSKQRALDLISAAKDAGADAIKFQRFTPELITLDSDDPHFTIKGGLWDGWKLIDLYRKAATPEEWFPDLYAKAAEVGIGAFSTCDTAEDVAFVNSLGVNPAFKVGSTCITNLELIGAMAATGKPVIISTLGSTWPEIMAAHATAIESGGTMENLAFLHCVSYGRPLNEANMGRIRELQDAFQGGETIGFSDHIRSHEGGTMAVAMGATIIEKHITEGRGDGLDDEFALTPSEFTSYVSAINDAWQAMQKPDIDNASVYMALRPTIHAVKDVAEGERFTRENIRAINPGGGMQPDALAATIGKTSTRSIPRGTPLTAEMVS
jgi:N-acetylneuraminate synthase